MDYWLWNITVFFLQLFHVFRSGDGGSIWPWCGSRQGFILTMYRNETCHRAGSSGCFGHLPRILKVKPWRTRPQLRTTVQLLSGLTWYLLVGGTRRSPLWSWHVMTYSWHFMAYAFSTCTIVFVRHSYRHGGTPGTPTGWVSRSTWPGGLESHVDRCASLEYVWATC